MSFLPALVIPLLELLTCKRGLILLLSREVTDFTFDNCCAIAGRCIAEGAAECHPGHTERLLPGDGVTRTMTHDLLEHFPKAGGHEVVQDGVDGRAEVEEDSGDDVDILEDLEDLIGPLGDEAPHEAVSVKRSPADPKDHHQNN